MPPKENMIMWIGWVLSAVFLLLAIIVGIFASMGSARRGDQNIAKGNASIAQKAGDGNVVQNASSNAQERSASASDEGTTGLSKAWIAFGGLVLSAVITGIFTLLAGAPKGDENVASGDKAVAQKAGDGTTNQIVGDGNINIQNSPIVVKLERSIQNDAQRLSDELKATGPSSETQRLASQIPDDAGLEARELKAIGEGRYRDARELNERVQAEQTARLAEAYERRGSIETFAGRYADAVLWYDRARKLSPGKVKLLHESAAAQYRAGNYADARTLAERALTLYEDDHPELADLLLTLAIIRSAQADYGEAEQLVTRSRDMRLRIQPQNRSAVATCECVLAGILRDQGNYKDAIARASHSLEMRQDLGAKDAAVADSLYMLGTIQEKMGQTREARDLFESATDLWRQTLSNDHPKVAQGLYACAESYRIAGITSIDAWEEYNKAISITKRAYGERHPVYATCLDSFALFLPMMPPLQADAPPQANLLEAERLHKEAMAIRVEVLGPDHPDVATSANNLGFLYERQRKYEAAKEMFEKARTIRRDRLREKHPDYGVSLLNLASLYKEMGRHGDAERLFREALDVFTPALGEKHAYVAITLNNLASLYASEGRSELAEPLYQQAIEIAASGQHLHAARFMGHYADLLRKVGREEEAAEWDARARETISASMASRLQSRQQ